MARTHDPEIRDQLLGKAFDYVCEHGVSELSLRDLAGELGISPGSLLYHFGSKEGLMMELVRVGRKRQQQMVKENDDLTALWRAVTTPRWLPITRLFFEVYALALQAPDRFPGFAQSAVKDWIDAIEPSKDPIRRADATVVIALFRGLLLDYCATGDRKRSNLALERFAAIFVENSTAK